MAEDLVKIVCYGKEKEMTVKQAVQVYYGAFLCSEGSEKERYANILNDLAQGKKVCKDE